MPALAPPSRGPAPRAARALPWRALLVLAAGLGLGFGPTPALAGGLRVSPLRIDISPRRPIAQVELTNLTDKPVTAQVEVSAWAIDNGVEALTPTADIQFVPPIVSVPAGGRRTVRLRLRAAADVDTEKAYRVYVQEITAATNIDEADLNELASGAQFNIRFGLPLFVQPIRRSLAEAETAASREGGVLQVLVKNPGQIHLRVSGVTAYAAGTDRNKALPAPLASAALAPNASLYVMPGEELAWTFPAGQVPPGAALMVQTDAYSSRGNGNLLPNGRVWLTAP